MIETGRFPAGTIRKTCRIRTNDPDHPKIVLTLGGRSEVATLSSGGGHAGTLEPASPRAPGDARPQRRMAAR